MQREVYQREVYIKRKTTINVPDRATHYIGDLLGYRVFFYIEDDPYTKGKHLYGYDDSKENWIVYCSVYNPEVLDIVNFDKLLPIQFAEEV